MDINVTSFQLYGRDADGLLIKEVTVFLRTFRGTYIGFGM